MCTRGPRLGVSRNTRAAITDARHTAHRHGGSVPTLDELTIHWQWALDAGSRALDAASHELPRAALERHRGSLSHERLDTGALLDRVAREHHAHMHPWLSSLPVTPRFLGLPTGTEACIFDVDGVLADSGVLHAHAWAQVLDDLLLHRAAGDRVFVPFDPVDDYRAYIDGRPRVDGLHSFLASRGIRLPTGAPSDPPSTETVYGIAARKGLALEHVIHRTGVVALPGARAYLVAAGFARLRCGVVSTSATTRHVLQHAELDSLVQVIVDAATIAESGLRPRPAPDMLLTACERLGVEPARAVALTRSAAGLAAAEAAGMTALAVARGAQAERLAHFGAEAVTPRLADLLDPQLRASANGDAR
jgi:beta-phosphoglucomutase-like phosphatase (HAD superfamily)